MHFTKPLLALLTVLPFLTHADPEQALQFKAVDVARKRQANNGEWVSSHPQCTQVCDGFFRIKKLSTSLTASIVNKGKTEAAAQPPSTSSGSATQSVEPIEPSAQATPSSASTITQTVVQTRTSVIAPTAGSSSSEQYVPETSAEEAAPTVAPSRVQSSEQPPVQSSAAPAVSDDFAAGANPRAASADDIAAYLKAHNDERADYGAEPLTWSTELEAIATKVGSTCRFEHSGGAYGENLYMGSGTINFADGVYNWNDERSDQGGHWTQVVWKETTQVGCAIVVCENGVYIPPDEKTGKAQEPFSPGSNMMVCDYLKQGNVGGAYEANVGQRVAGA